MTTVMRWIPVTEQLPPDSSKVLITDGKNISCAHFFGIVDAKAHVAGEGEIGDICWANQHERLTDRWIEKPTHWMAMETLQTWTQLAVAGNLAVPLPLMLKDQYDVEELDNVLDTLTSAGISHSVLVGKKVVYHNDRVYTLVKHGITVAIRRRVHCEYCNKRGPTLYFKSGLHNGAFCYAFNKRGKYVANFRDQVYICTECENKKGKA